MAGISIIGTGRYVPAHKVTNQMLETIVDTSDEWITLRTGIKERANAEAHESSLSMAQTAAERALAASGIAKEEIGVLIVATLTGDYLTPSLSCLLQREMGLPEEIIPMDVNCACSGFVYGVKTAHALLADCPDKYALVVGCEMLSKMTDYTDRSTCIIFGDGAGAAVLRRTQEGDFCFHGGAKGDSELLYCRAQYLCNNPFADRSANAQPGGVFMNGPEVFRFVLESATKSVHAVLAQAGITIDDIDHFVFHQANARIIQGVTKRLGLPIEKCPINIEYTGNTSSASVALLLDELNESGRLKRGDRVVISAFGGGLTYASICFIW